MTKVFSHNKAIVHIAQQLHIPERRVRAVINEMFGHNVRSAFFDPNNILIPKVGKFVPFGTKPIRRIKEKSHRIQMSQYDRKYYQATKGKKKKKQHIVEPEPYHFDLNITP